MNFSARNIIIGIIVIVLAVAIPVTVRLAQQRQQLKSQAAGEEWCSINNPKFCTSFYTSPQRGTDPITVNKDVYVFVKGEAGDTNVRLDGTISVSGTYDEVTHVGDDAKNRCGDRNFNFCWIFKIDGSKITSSDQNYVVIFASDQNSNRISTSFRASAQTQPPVTTPVTVSGKINVAGGGSFTPDGKTVTTCYPQASSTVTTSGSGEFNFSIPTGTSFCIRGPNADNYSVQADNGKGEDVSSYEWQVAGIDCANNQQNPSCVDKDGSKKIAKDRAVDQGYNFTYTNRAPPPTPQFNAHIESIQILDIVSGQTGTIGNFPGGLVVDKTYRVTFNIRNTQEGNAQIWPVGVKLVYQGNDAQPLNISRTTISTNREVPSVDGALGTYAFVTDIRPSTKRLYDFNWQMQKPGGSPFGEDTAGLQLNVNQAPGDPPSPGPSASPPVGGSDAPSIDSFIVSPDSGLIGGQEVTFNWFFRRTPSTDTRCAVTGPSSVGSNFPPSETTATTSLPNPTSDNTVYTYTLRCSNSVGSDSKPVTVRVNKQPNAPVVILNLITPGNRSEINSGEVVSLQWSVTGDQLQNGSCNATNSSSGATDVLNPLWNGTKSIGGGTQPMQLTNNTSSDVIKTFNLTCTNGLGRSSQAQSASITVKSSVTPSPSPSIGPSPSPSPVGGALTCTGVVFQGLSQSGATFSAPASGISVPVVVSFTPANSSITPPVFTVTSLTTGAPPLTIAAGNPPIATIPSNTSTTRDNSYAIGTTITSGANQATCSPVTVVVPKTTVDTACPANITSTEVKYKNADNTGDWFAQGASIGLGQSIRVAGFHNGETSDTPPSDITLKYVGPQGVTTPPAQSGAVFTPTRTGQYTFTATTTGKTGDKCVSSASTLAVTPALQNTLCFVLGEGDLGRTDVGNVTTTDARKYCTDNIGKTVGLGNAKVYGYTDITTVVPNYAFKDPVPGIKTIFVKFVGLSGANTVVSDRKEQSITFKPLSKISNVDCISTSLAPGTQAKITGSFIGPQGKSVVKIANQEATIDNWDTATNTITAHIDQRLDGKNDVSVTFDDGTTATAAKLCIINTVTASFKTALQCKDAGAFAASNVDLKVYEGIIATTQPVSPDPILQQKISLDNAGLPQGFAPKFEKGKKYELIIKAPGTLARRVDFDTSKGSANINDGNPITLPQGDIAPRNAPDGKINAFDKSELIRQWSIVTDVARTGDLNGDSRINSVDYACMRQNINDSDQGFSPLTAASPSPSPSGGVTPSPSPSPAASPAASPVASPSPGASAFTIAIDDPSVIIQQGNLAGGLGTVTFNLTPGPHTIFIKFPDKTTPDVLNINYTP